jgi:hypothetical protein
VYREGVEFHKRVFIQQEANAFPCGVLAARVLLFDRFGAGGLLGTGLAVTEIGNLSRGRGQIVAHQVSPALLQIGSVALWLLAG